MAKINPQTLRKLNLYKQNPDIVQPLSNAELADLVVLVLNQVELIDNSIKDKTVDINKMLTANVNELLAEYKRTAAQAKEETKEAIAEARKAAQDSTAATNAAIEDVVQRVQARLDNLSDGQDGIVTEAEIARAAEIAATLIELPDFEQMVQTEITSNGERVRDALELLQGENRYRVQQEDVEGLRDDLKKLWDAVVAKSAGQGGTIGKGQVYGFIQQAIADGIIQSSITTIDEIGDVETTGATDGQVLTWVDSNERWEAVDAPGASGGEANTASNVGTGGVGIFKQKSLVDLQFKKLNAGSAKVTITDDTGNDEVDIDIDESAISYNNIADTPTIPSGALADLDTVGTAQIDNDAVTLDKIADAAVVTEAEGIASNDNDTTLPTSAAVKDYVDNNTPSGTVDVVSNVATSTILGRTTAGSGDSEELTAAQVRTLINVEDGADVTDTANVTAAGALMDSEVDADIKTLSLPANTTISAFGATLVDDADAATARTTLGVDAAGTDNSTDVTLAGTPDYITITGQTITRNQIDLTADVTGVLPEANLPDASSTAQGVVELATAAETTTGTDTGRVVTPDGLAGSNFGIRYVQVVCFDYTTDTATGDGKGYFHIPAAMNGMNLVEVHAEVITAGTTGTTDIQIANVTQAADMLSTKITIDSGETGSDTAAAAAVIDTANDDVATNDLIRIDVDAVSTTAAKGLIVTLGFQLA